MSSDDAVDAAARPRQRCASRPRQCWQARGAARAPADRRPMADRGRACSLVWLIAVQPALRTLREAPAELDRLDSQLQQMQLAALESATLRSALAGAAGAGGRGAARRDRAARRQGASSRCRAIAPRSRFTGVPFESLRTWLGEARSAARARPVEAQLLQGRRRLQRLDLAHPGGQPRDRARKRNRQLWSPTVASTGWSESTLAEQAWVEARGAAVRWAVAGAHRRRRSSASSPSRRRPGWRSAVASSTGQRLRPRRRARHGLVGQRRRRCSTGGPGSRDATSLPGRLEWTLAPRWYGVELAARHDCCLNGTVAVQIRPGLGRVRATLVPRAGWVGQWPSAWLGGLGTPWNTLQLGGSVRLLSPGRDDRIGRRAAGGSTARPTSTARRVSSRLTTLDTLGSYRVALTGGGASTGATAAHADDAGRRAAAQRQRHLGAGRRQLPRRGARRRRPTRRRCRTCSTSSGGATARDPSFRSDEHDQALRPARDLAAQGRRRGDRRRSLLLGSTPMPARSRKTRRARRASAASR